MPLSELDVRRATPREKPYRLFDARGLYLEVVPRGGRWWRFKYRFAGKEKRLSLGTYPETGLKDARTRRDAARLLLAANQDPAIRRRVEKIAHLDAASNTFKAIALEWFASREHGWAKSHSEKVKGRLENHIFPTLGRRPIRSISGPEVLDLVQRIASKSPDTARRVLQNMGCVFRYAMRSHRADADPSYKLSEVLPPKSSDNSHFAAIVEPKAVGGLLRALDGYDGSLVVAKALQLAPLVFVRPGELRHAEWAEIDFAKAEWRIPASKMKGRREHLVPLSSQAVAILQAVNELTGHGRYVFPSIRTRVKPMSENTLNAALRSLGFAGNVMTAHGFRTMASTLLHELGYASHLIETQLAHSEPNEVKAAYNRAAYLTERVGLMQEWADFLDGLRAGASVIPLRIARRG